MKNTLANLEVNFVSLSDTIALGIPRNLKNYPMNIFAMLVVVCVDLKRIKCIALVNISTTTMIESICFAILSDLIIKSTVISSHFHSGVEKVATSMLGIDAQP